MTFNPDNNALENVQSTLKTRSADTDYISLNAQLEQWGTNEAGEKYIQYGKDREAARQYFLNHVNPNTVFFYSLEEKLTFLVENEYYESEFLNAYDSEFIKQHYKNIYAHKFRFDTFVGALKFYNQYALRNFAGNRYLERFEDRVAAVSLYLAEGNESKATKLAEEIITGRFQPATPTFLNAGRKQRGDLVSCFLLNVTDDLNSIMRAVNSSAQLSKRGGGVAINLSSIRAKGDPIKKVENQSSGVIPIMKILEDTFSYANQLGARQGAGAVYLNAHHLDILDFLDTKRENADEKIRIKTLSLGVVIPDITFELARKGEKMYLFSPYDLQQEYGKEMAWLNISDIYREAVENPRIRKKAINPREFLTTLAEIQMESGYPYILFEDAANRGNRVPGKIIMSNLCLTGDTRLLTDKGYRRFDELFTSQEGFRVLSDDRSVTEDFEAATVSLKDSTKAFLTKKNAETYKISTKEGFEVKATAWHKFPVERDGEIVVKRLGELEIGDHLLVQPKEGVFGSVHNPDLAYVAGVLAADGNYAKNASSSGATSTSALIYLYGDQAEAKESVQAAVHSVLKGRTDLVQRQSTLTPEWQEDEERGCVSIHSAPLAKLLAEYGITPETKTRVPEFVWRGDKETVLSYLSGIYQMDSCISGSKEGKTLRIELGSIHQKFLQEIQQLLLNLGVYSRIYSEVEKEAGEKLLPDGKGGLAPYNQSKTWSLRVSAGEDRVKLYDCLTWLQRHRDFWEDYHQNEEVGTRRGFHRFRATVTAIDFYSIEDVYDVTVEDGHSIIVDGLSTRNCSEILQPQEPSVVNDEQIYTTYGKDISCNLGSLNVAKLLRTPDFEESISTAIRTLSTVSDLSDIDAVPTVREGNHRSHAVGLGIMNLHGAFVENHIFYGDEEALDLTNILGLVIQYNALKASNAIAVEKGKTFDGFPESEYASGEFFTRYTNPETQHLFTPKTDKVRALFAERNIHIPTPEDWSVLADKVRENGLYNQNLLAIAPTGSISYIAHATPSFLPVTFTVVEKRTEGKVGTVYTPNYAAEGNEEYYEGYNMYDIDSKKVIDIASILQYYVDQSMSLTLGYKNKATTKDVTKNVLYAFSKGKPSTKKSERTELLEQFPSAEIKSMYYVRVYNEVLAGTQDETCVSCSI